MAKLEGDPYVLAGVLYGSLARGEPWEKSDIDFISDVINIDQSPIGRTPRSNPATELSRGEAQRIKPAHQLGKI